MLASLGISYILTECGYLAAICTFKCKGCDFVFKTLSKNFHARQAKRLRMRQMRKYLRVSLDAALIANPDNVDRARCSWKIFRAQFAMLLTDKARPDASLEEIDAMAIAMADEAEQDNPARKSPQLPVQPPAKLERQLRVLFGTTNGRRVKRQRSIG